MSRPRRGWSDREVDEYCKQQAELRADRETRERMADPSWQLVPDAEFPEFGLTWQRKQEG